MISNRSSAAASRPETRPRWRRATVVAGGRVTIGPRVRQTLEDTDILIAADSGVVHCLSLGLTPDLVVGDFDSAPVHALEDARALGWNVRVAPVEKDATDGELALREALSRGAQEVVLLGVLEGDDRVDHALANVLLLALPETEGCAVRLLDEMREAHLLRNRESVALSGRRGDIVSLLPLTEAAQGVTTWGLKYDLSGVTLRLGSTRGVSNELVWPQAQVQLAGGMLFVFHERREANAL